MLRPALVWSVERARSHVPVVDIKYASSSFARVRVQIAKRYKDNYHRYKAHFPAMDLLGFSDPDFNESHEDDMLKMVRPASDRHNDSTVLPRETHFPIRCPLYSVGASLTSRPSVCCDVVVVALRDAITTRNSTP